MRGDKWTRRGKKWTGPVLPPWEETDWGKNRPVTSVLQTKVIAKLNIFLIGKIL